MIKISPSIEKHFPRIFDVPNPSNDNVMHEGFHEFKKVCLELNKKNPENYFVGEWIERVARCHSKTSFNNFHWFVKFEKTFLEDAAQERRDKICAVE